MKCCGISTFRPFQWWRLLLLPCFGTANFISSQTQTPGTRCVRIRADRAKPLGEQGACRDTNPTGSMLRGSN